MKEFEKKIKTKIKNLPLHDPEQKAWEAICKRLDFNNKLTERVQELPFHEPLENAWNKIEIKIKPTLKISSTRYLLITLSTAAAIALFIGIWSINRQRNRETITVTQEVINDWKQPAISNADTISQTAIQYINKQCETKSYICDRPGFNEKKKQLQEIDNQIKELQNIINTTGSSPSLIISSIKLENLRTRLMKDLLNIIST